jgi:hypothetical protein
MLQHVSLAFPSPRGHACIVVANGDFQIQHLPPTFGLKARNLCYSLKILFNGIQNREGRIFILITIQHPI